MFLQKLAHQLFRGLGVATRLHQEVQNFAFIVYSSPKPVTFPSNNNHHLVQMPMVAWCRPLGSQIARYRWAKLQAPTTHCLVGHVQTAFGHQIFYIPETQCELGV